MSCLSIYWTAYERQKIKVYVVFLLVDLLCNHLERLGGQDIVVGEDDTTVDWPFAVPIKSIEAGILFQTA